MNEKEMAGDELYSRFWKACALFGRDQVFWYSGKDSATCAGVVVPMPAQLDRFEVKPQKLYTVSVEIPEPLKEFPVDGRKVFVVDLLAAGGWAEINREEKSAFRWLELGLCYDNKIETSKAAGAMLERRRGEK